MLSGPLPRLENEKRKKMKILVTERKKKKNLEKLENLKNLAVIF